MSDSRDDALRMALEFINRIRLWEEGEPDLHTVKQTVKAALEQQPKAEPQPAFAPMSEDEAAAIFKSWRVGPLWLHMVRGTEAHHAAARLEPVGWFFEDHNPGQLTQYHRVAAEHEGDPDTFQLYRVK